jgi:hypothetical protein
MNGGPGRSRAPRRAAPPATTSGWIPSRLDRLRATAVGAPQALLFAVGNPSASFEPGEGGSWAWYPKAGSFVPHRLDRSWSLRGRGGALVGSLRLSEDRARFVPSAYWRRNGITDWEVTVDRLAHRGPWLRIDSPNGWVVLRRTGNTPLDGRRSKGPP